MNVVKANTQVSGVGQIEVSHRTEMRIKISRGNALRFGEAEGFGVLLEQ